MARVGILGGTFNPPHLGHLICAQEAHVGLALDRVLLMPVHLPPHKEVPDDPGPSHRLELCRRAVGDDRRLEVCALEVKRGGRSWTVDTLRTLHERDPEDELILICGGDMALSLPTWREPAEILRLARVGVAERSGARRADIEERLSALCPGERVEFFEMPRVDVSSSLVRARLRAGQPVRYLVPDPVLEYVDRHALYARESP